MIIEFQQELKKEKEIIKRGREELKKELPFITFLDSSKEMEKKIKIIKYYKYKRRVDPIFRLKCNLRKRIRKILKIYKNINKISNLKSYNRVMGLDIKEFWNKRPLDYEEWNKNNTDNPYTIDHIIPLSKWNINNLKEANNIKNLQWMKLKDNIKKSDTI